MKVTLVAEPKMNANPTTRNRPDVNGFTHPKFGADISNCTFGINRIVVVVAAAVGCLTTATLYAECDRIYN